MNLQEIQSLTETLAHHHRGLAAAVQERENALAAANARFAGHIHSAATSYRRAHFALFAAITAAPELFKKPRTITVNGIKVGYQKKKGTIVIFDEEKTIEKIRDQFARSTENYLNVTTKVDKKAVEKLDGAMLKKLGIQITADTDAIVIKLADSPLEKIIDSILANDANLKQEAA